MSKLLGLIFFSMIVLFYTSAQQLDLNIIAATEPEELSKAMPGLAKEVIAKYKDEDREKYLDNLFRLQMIAENYGEANATIKSLRDILQVNDPVHANLTYVQYEIFSNAKLIESAKEISFEDAFQQSFRDAYRRLSDIGAHRVSGSFVYDLTRGQSGLQETLDKLKGNNRIELNDALELARQYQPYQVYKIILPLTDALIKEEQNRRYIIHDDVLIKTKEGATLSAIIVRKRGVTTAQPAALCFNIYTDFSFNLATVAAAYGYVGVTAETRGKRLSPDEIDTYEHVAKDTYGVIDWISKQPWSNGKVGMFGGSYSGFSAWAATKTLHPA